MEYYIWAVLLVAVLYAMYQSQSKTDKTEEAIVMDAPNLEFGYPQPADVLAYEGETLVTENDRQELLQYFAKQAYDWHKGYFIKRNDLLGHFSRNFVELAGMAGEYCENMLREHTNNDGLKTEINHKIRKMDDIADTVQRVAEEVRASGGVDLDGGELWHSGDLSDLDLVREHYGYMSDQLARAGLRPKDY